MPGYNNWVVGGITVPHVREVSHNTQEGIIELQCSAISENILPGDSDVRDEIAYFQALSSQFITNEPLLNGGSKLQIGTGQFIVVTDGNDSWNKCALGRIEIKEDSVSEKRIDYALKIHYEMEGAGAIYIYLADKGYCGDFSNIVCYQASTKAGSVCTTCTNWGWLEITELADVARVELYGCAYRSYDVTPAWIECNGDRQYWSYNAEGDLDIGFEKLVWDLDIPVKVIELQTSNHVSPFTSGNGLGAWVQWIKVIFD